MRRRQMLKEIIAPRWTTTRRPRGRRRPRWPAASTVMAAAAIVAVASTPGEPSSASQDPTTARRGDGPVVTPPDHEGIPEHRDGAPPIPEGAGWVVPVAHGRGIPGPVLAAYQRAADALGASQPGCRLPLALLAAIGKIETGHARGGQVDATGTTLRPIFGPALDGTGVFAAIPDTDGGRYDADTRWDRAVGPMQFIPGTWARWASDGNADRRADPHNVFDASLSAGRYLCAGGRDLTSEAGLREAILSYNNSISYLTVVLAWMRAYSNGMTAIPTEPSRAPQPAEPGTLLAGPAAVTPTPPPTPPPATNPVPTAPPLPAVPVPPPQPSPQPPAPLPALTCAVGDLLNHVTGLPGTLLGQPSTPDTEHEEDGTPRCEP